MATEWGRDERTDWPSSKPVYTILLLIVSALFGAGVECAYDFYVWTPLQRHYLPMYVGTQIAGAIRKDGWYTLLVLETRKESRLALDGEVQAVVTENGDTTFALTDDAIKQGALRLEWQRHSYDNIKLHDFLGRWIYQGQTFTDLAKPGLRGMAIVFLAGLWPAVSGAKAHQRTALRKKAAGPGPDDCLAVQLEVPARQRHRLYKRGPQRA